MTNGEKYKTAKERLIAFESWCKCITCGSCEGCELKDIHIECKNGLVCPLLWPYLEAEEEKPMNCPFCGANTEVVIDECGCYVVSCTHCEYGSPAYNKDEFAISAHNRVCKAVAAYKENN